MSERTMKMGVEMTGEQKFKQESGALKRELQVLKAELKSETAALGANATQAEKDAVKQKSLTAQIKAQEAIVAKNKERLKELETTQKGNTAAIQKMKIEYENSKTSLSNMKNEADRLNEALKATKESTESAVSNIESVGDAAEKASDKITDKLIKDLSFNQSVEKFKTFASAAKGALDGIRTAAEGVVNGIKDIVKQTASAADELATRSATSGLSVETLTMLQAAENLGDDIPMEAFAAAATRLGRAMNDDIFGVKVTGSGKNKKTEVGALYGQKGDNVEDTMWNVLQWAAQNWNPNGDNSATEDALKTVFGGSFDQLLPFIQNPAAYEEYFQKASEMGIARDAEQIAELVGINDKLDRLNALQESIKQLFTLVFAGEFGEVIDGYGDMMQALNDYENAVYYGDSEKEAEALGRMRDGASVMLNGVSEFINSFWEKLKETIKGFAEQTDEEGNPTALANLAKGLLGLADKMGSLDLAKMFEDFCGAVDTFVEVMNKIAQMLGIDLHPEQGKGGLVDTTDMTEQEAAAAIQQAGADALKGSAMEGIVQMLPSGVVPAPEAPKAFDFMAATQITPMAAEAAAPAAAGVAEALYDALRGGNGYGSELDAMRGMNVAWHDSEWGDILESLYAYGQTGAQDLPEEFAAALEGYITGGDTAGMYALLEQLDNGDWLQVAGAAATQDMSEGVTNAMTAALKDIRAGVRDGLSGMGVYMDGQSVGSIAAPYVSEYISNFVGVLDPGLG